MRTARARADPSSRAPATSASLHADTRMARAMLGFSAELDFEEGLSSTIAWFSGQYDDPAVLLEENLRNWQMPVG